MDQAAWNDLLEKEKGMEQSRKDMKDKVKKMQNDITHAPDGLTRKKLQLGLSNLLLAQQKLEIDYETLQNQKRLMQLESFMDKVQMQVMVLEAEGAKDPVAGLNEKIDQTKLKIGELQQKAKETLQKAQLEKDAKKLNLRLDARILKQQIKKLQIDMTIFGFQIDKINNTKNVKEALSKLCRGVFIKNEDINGYGHRFIPRYRGVKTVHNHGVNFDRVEDAAKMTEEEVDQLIDKNYDTYCGFSKQQKEIFTKEFNELTADLDDIDDEDMIVAISRLGIVISSENGDDSNSDNDDNLNPDGTVGSLYDNIEDYVGE